MGFFSWFSAKTAAGTSLSAQTDIHMTLADATRPFAPKANNASPAKAITQTAASSSSQRLEQRRSERNARRELLFQVVRESMVRVGVLSSAFKFKVLALDQRGQTFLVMVDLSAEFAGETDKLTEIESLISQSAKNRFDLAVQAVYWRFYDTVVSNTITRSHAASAVASAPAPLFALPPKARSASEPPSAKSFATTLPLGRAPVQPATEPKSDPKSEPTQPFLAAVKTTAGDAPDPLDSNEVEAFKRALASGAQPGMSIPLGGATPASYKAQVDPPSAAPRNARAAAPARSATPVATFAAVPTTAAIAAAAAASKAAAMAAIHNKLLLTGYEDTEMPDPDAPVLSPTQYGELH